MLTEANLVNEFPPRSLVRSWPQLFTTRRQFDRQAENQPYLEWLTNRFGDGYDDNEDSDQASDDEDETSEMSSKEEDGVEVCNQGTVGSKEEVTVRDPASPVRRFMEGMVGNEDLLPYRDQVEVVSTFCEQAGYKECETQSPSKDKKVVALLDERNNSGALPTTRGNSRTYLGPLTAQQLKDALSKKVV